MPVVRRGYVSALLWLIFLVEILCLIVNNESLNAMAEEAKMNSSEFSQLTAKALMRKVDSERFCYEISSTDTGKTLQLVWMEKDKKAGVNVS